MTSTVLEAFSFAKSQADFNRARLSLQRFGVPEEVRTLAREMPGLPRDVVRWLRRLDTYCHWEQPATAEFERAKENDEWVLYSRPTAVGAPRVLLIGFAGAVGNLFQPTPVILQHLPARITSLLLLHDTARHGFTRGLSASLDLQGLISRLATLAGQHYAVLTLGTSAGGHAALYIASGLGASRAVAVGGRPRTDFPSEKDSDANRCDCVCVYGALHRRDREGALALAAKFPTARPVAVDGITEHNVLHAAFQGGRLSQLFAALLGDSPIPIESLHAGGSDELRLAIPPHRAMSVPVWATADADRRGLTLWRRGRWTVQSQMRWRLLASAARSISLGPKLALNIESAVLRGFGVRLRFRRR